MLCGCRGNKKGADELSLYGAPRSRGLPMSADLSPWSRDLCGDIMADMRPDAAVIRADEEYPGTYVSSVNQGFDSGFDSGTLGGSQYSSPESSTSNTQRTPLDMPTLRAPSLPMLEFCEKSENLEGITTHGHRMFQQYRGQLKLCVYLNSGLITVHVIQGRNFTSKFSSYCNSYIKLSLSPDPLRRTRCKTSVSHETNNPVIDEKISFELIPEDVHKRLMVSVWNKDTNQNGNELLGCMSFGIQNIVEEKTVINGWFFLLSEKVGKRKHLQSQNKRKNSHDNHSNGLVTSQSESCFSLATSSPSSQTTVSESSVSTTTETTCGSLQMLQIRRGWSGFGISLTGGSPVQVYQVEPRSPADLAGLRSGAHILNISGQDVSRATADTVARIFRFSETEVTLHVHHCTAPLCSLDFLSPKSSLRDLHTSGNSSGMSYT